VVSKVGLTNTYVLIRRKGEICTVKPVLIGHLWDKKKWPHKTGGLLKEVQFV